MSMKHVRLISWNVKGRRDLRDHLTFVGDRSPQLVALQELNPNANHLELLNEMELRYVKSTAGFADRRTKPFRRYAVLIASKWPLRVSRQGWDCYVPWPERVLSVIVEAPFGEFELHTAYIPCGESHGWIKIRTFNGIFRRLAYTAKHRRVLCGDFNTPQEETPEGLVITWGQRRKPNGDLAFHKGWGERWDEGERNILTGLARYNLADAYRSLYGYKVTDWSWQDAKREGVRRRFDHVFASPSMDAWRFEYLSKAVERELSDHKAVEVDFSPRL
jgi:exonuclease III